MTTGSTFISRALLLGAPALALAVVGLFHPHHLTYATSWRWLVIHVLGLVVFPLIGLALAELVRGRRDAVSWMVRATAYLFATFYTALDVISGIAAGFVTHELGGDASRTDGVRLLFRIGAQLGQVGSIALIACATLLVFDQLVRRRALPVVALLPGAVLVHVGHIYAPTGVAGMVLIAVGTVGAALWPADVGGSA